VHQQKKKLSALAIEKLSKTTKINVALQNIVISRLKRLHVEKNIQLITSIIFFE
jgi:hypothetical protein